MNIEIMKQITTRLDRLERAVFNSDSKTDKEGKRSSSSGEGLPIQILKLRDKGFFKEPKTAIEVHSKLQPSYHCELNRVAMALLRLQRRKELRKSSKIFEEKRQVAYVW